MNHEAVVAAVTKLIREEDPRVEPGALIAWVEDAIKAMWRPMEEVLPLVPPYKPNQYNPHWRCLLRLPDSMGPDYVTLGWAYWVLPRSPDKPPLLRWGCPTGQCWPKFWMPLPDVAND